MEYSIIEQLKKNITKMYVPIRQSDFDQAMIRAYLNESSPLITYENINKQSENVEIISQQLFELVKIVSLEHIPDNILVGFTTHELAKEFSDCGLYVGVDISDKYFHIFNMEPLNMCINGQPWSDIENHDENEKQYNNCKITVEEALKIVQKVSKKLLEVDNFHNTLIIAANILPTDIKLLFKNGEEFKINHELYKKEANKIEKRFMNGVDRKFETDEKSSN